MLQKLRELTDELGQALESSKKPNTSKLDFRKAKAKHAQAKINNILLKMDGEIHTISSTIHNLEQLQTIVQVFNSVKSYPEIKTVLALKKLLPVEKSSKSELPTSIKLYVIDDIEEMQRCYHAQCYRSVIILCGRIMEVALHRKYYDLTKKDILETAPNIGLGKLIAKLHELNVALDPGITQQIHLINQVRISSVHKKEQDFNPSQEQTRAIMLYTIDILKKMF